MARPMLTEVKSFVADAMVSNLWDISFPAGSLPPAIASAAGGNILQSINFRAVSAEIPKRTGNSLEISIRGHKIKQPGDYDYSGAITLTLIESDIGADVHQLIAQWREAIIRTDSGYQKKMKDIKAEGVILRRLNRQNGAQQGTGSTSTIFYLHGVFLEDYELGEMNEAGDIIQPTVTLSYDNFDNHDFIANPSASEDELTLS